MDNPWEQKNINEANVILYILSEFQHNTNLYIIDVKVHLFRDVSSIFLREIIVRHFGAKQQRVEYIQWIYRRMVSTLQQ